jgi:hypothetical protein
MVRLGESKVMLASRKHSLLLMGTREAIRARIYGMNPLLLLKPRDVEMLIAELIEWRAELLEATTRRQVPQPQKPLRRRVILAEPSTSCDS